MKRIDWWQVSSGVSNYVPWRSYSGGFDIYGVVGIFSESKITPKGNPLDTLCATLEEKMAYEEGERDFVVSIIFVL